MEELALQHPDLIGRNEELSKLRSSLYDSFAGKGSTIFISGEAGIGKTRLVSELKKEAEKMEVNIIQGRCMAESLEPLMPIRSSLKEAGLFHLISGDPPPNVISIYLISDDGKLISKVERETSELDPDIFASMLVVINDFVQESLSMMDKSTGDRLNSMGYGNFTILIQTLGKISLAMVIEGAKSEFLIDDMKRTLEEIGSGFDNWAGDHSDTLEVNKKIRWFMDSGKYDGRFMADDPQLKQENLFDNVLLGLQRQCSDRPTILFIDDLHWADPTTLNLLCYLSRNSRKDRLLILGTYRPEDIVESWNGKTHQLATTMQNMSRDNLLENIDLERLDLEGTASLVKSTLGKVMLDNNFYTRIFKGTEGTPFFVLEVVKLLMEDGAFELDDEGAWTLVHDIDNFDIPSKVYDVVKRRLDRLLKEQRELLECASVVGEEFDSEILGNMVGLEKMQLLKSLSEIEKTHKLIHYLKERYRFDHAKIREVLYNDISEELRREYHRIVGDALAEVYEGRQEEVVSDLAHHYHEAKDKKAGFFSLKAGDIAKENYANQEAMRFYRNALDYIDDRVSVLEAIGDVQLLNGEYDAGIENFQAALNLTKENMAKARILLKSGKAYEKKGEYEESLRVLAEAKELVEPDTVEYGQILLEEGNSYFKMGGTDRAMSLISEAINIAEKNDTDKKDTGRALGVLGMIHESMGEYDIALQNLERSLKIMEELGEQSGIALALNSIGIIHNNRGEMDTALEYKKRSLAIREKIGDKQGIASSLNNIGIVYVEKGELSTALKCFELCLVIGEKIGDKHGIAHSLNNIGNVHYEMGELDITLECYIKSLEVLVNIGNKQGIGLLLDNVGIMYYYRGELETALEYHERSLTIREEIGDKQGAALALDNIGNVYHEKGELDTAMEFHERSLGICLEIGDKLLSIYDYSSISEIHIELANIPVALDYAKKAVGIAVEIGAKEEEGMSLRVLGMIYREKEEWNRSNEEFRKARIIFEDTGNKRELTRLFYEYGLLWKARNEPAKANEYFDKALSGFEHMGMKLWTEKCQKALSELDI